MDETLLFRNRLGSGLGGARGGGCVLWERGDVVARVTRLAGAAVDAALAAREHQNRQTSVRKPNSSMPDYAAMSVEELEQFCGTGLREFYRSRYPDPAAYRERLLDYYRTSVEPIDAVLDLLRRDRPPAAAWNELLATFRRLAPTRLWDLLPAPDLDEDIARALEWLSTELDGEQAVTGLYLGLDTLNMDEERGEKNVEIGGSGKCDPSKNSDEWLADLRHGGNHLIRGLRAMHRIYSAEEWENRDPAVPGSSPFSFADYNLFLGYAGIVLGNALKQMPEKTPRLVIWGFHDGDLFLLGRKTASGFEWICRLPEQA